MVMEAAPPALTTAQSHPRNTHTKWGPVGRGIHASSMSGGVTRRLVLPGGSGHTAPHPEL
eukprot:2819865-Amphidinium_carterae.1